MAADLQAHIATLIAELDTETPHGPVLLPSAGFYTGIFAWDSAWHYFFLKEVDAPRARQELETLFATADADGRVPHETRFAGAERHGPLRRFQMALLGNTYAPDGRSRFIDPPVYAWAAADALRAGSPAPGDPAANRQLFHAAVGSLTALRRQRSLPALPYPYSELPVILHPLESGTDGSPQFDEIYGGRAGTLRAMVGLGRKLARLDWQPARALAAGVPVIFDVTVISFYLLGLLELRSVADAAEAPEAAETGTAASADLPDRDEILALVRAFLAEFWNPDAGIFTSRRLEGPTETPVEAARIRRCRTGTMSGLLPLLFPLSEHAASGRPASAPPPSLWPEDVPAPGELLQRHGCGGTFWEDYLPRYTAPPGGAEGRGGAAGWGGRERLSRLLWRGPCSWMNMNYLLWRLLQGYGRAGEAAELATRAGEVFTRLGPYEYFHADGSRGGGALPFSWNGLLLAMTPRPEDPALPGHA